MSHPPLPPGGPPISPPPGPPHGMPHGVPHSAPPPSGGPPLPSGPPPPGHPPVVHQPPGYPPADTSSYYGGGYGAYPGYPPAPQGYPPAPPQGYYQSPYPPTSSYPPSQVAVRPTMRPAAPHVNPPPGTLGASPKQYSPSPSGTKEARTLYITGIDQSVDEQTFREFFASYFPVVRCRLAGDSEHPSRFGFMELEKESDAADMTTYSMQVKLKGRPLRIVHSKAAIQSENAQSSRVSQAGAPRTIHCTGFPAAATEKELVDYFQLKLNIGKITNIRVCGEVGAAGRFCFVEFEQDETVIKAITHDGCSMDGSILRIMRSRSVIQAGSGSAAFAATLPPGTIQMGAVQPLPPSQSGTAGLSLLVEGFGEEVDGALLETLFGKLGRLKTVEVKTNELGQRSAVIEMLDADGASKAVQLNGSQYGGGRLNVVRLGNGPRVASTHSAEVGGGSQYRNKLQEMSDAYMLRAQQGLPLTSDRERRRRKRRHTSDSSEEERRRKKKARKEERRRRRSDSIDSRDRRR